MYDLTLIKTNKDEALDLSRKLGFSEIFFIDKDIIIKNLKEIRHNKLNIVLGGSDNLNREILNNRNVTILLNPEPAARDPLTHKNSGLNQVLCNLASKNKIAIGFSIDRINEQLIGKIMQNIKLCRKYKIKMLFFTLAKTKNDLRSAYDLLSLLYSLGMNTEEAKYALTGIKEIKEKYL